jgi:hypothetical protein
MHLSTQSPHKSSSSWPFLKEKQTGEAWGPSNKRRTLSDLGEHQDRKVI